MTDSAAFPLPLNSPGCTLRRALPGDAPAIAACVDAAYGQWVARIGRKPWPMMQDYSSVVQSELVVVAEVGSDVVGVVVLSHPTGGFLLDNVAVRPSHQARGIGKALLVYAEQEARARGHDSLYLYTNEKMTENIALYEKIGYVEYLRGEGEGFRRVFMRKRLA